MTAVVDAINQRYEFVYDALGHLTQEKKGTATKSFTYDAAGNRSQRNDYNNAVTNYTFDALNRLTTIAYPDSTTASYGYDVLSRLTNASNQNGTVALSYDNRGRLSSVTDVFGQVVSYGYDANSNRTQLSLSGVTAASYEYDVLNRLTQLTDAYNSVFTFSYDIGSKLATRTSPNGVAMSYQYDGLNRLTRVTHSKAGSTLADFQYQFDAVNNILQMTDAAGTHSYAYDSLYRLTSATHPNQTNESYAYDDVGNRTASQQGSNYSYQAFNRLVAANGLSFGYDANGNLISKIDPSGTWSYLWDYENRLKQASLVGGPTLSYQYDALGRRVQRTSSSGGVTKYVYDRADVVRELNDDLTIATDYLSGPYLDKKLKQVNASGALYFVGDHLGTTRGLTDAGGNLSSTVSYDSFGNATIGAATNYTFSGREFDVDTGLINYRARWYDPRQGRFISEDPIGFNGRDINLYRYVWNNPIRYRDPFGLDGWGNDAADWLDARIEYAREYWHYCDQEWIANGVNDTVAEVAFGFTDLLRVGNGLGQAISAEDENWYGRAAFVLQDVKRASSIFQLLAAPATRLTPTRDIDNPLNTLRPGRYARRWIPARGPGRDFNAAERSAINDIGRDSGCHTCGTTDPGTKSGNFIPDHQPPSSLNPPGGPQRLYPHCLSCSRLQGGQIRQMQK